MIALIVGDAREGALRAMAPRGIQPMRSWRDPRGRGAAISAAPDLLPEDVYDRQPIEADGRLFLCRVRLDERDALGARLGFPPERIRVMADSALLFAAWQRWGDDCPQQVRGDYAYIAWRPDEAIVEAAVDHWGGSAAVFWARLGRGLIVADNLAVLLRHPDVDRTLDHEALAGFLRTGIDRRTTPYAGVRTVPGGHRLAWRDGSVTVRRWWNPDTDVDWSRGGSSLVEEVRERFQRAVAARLRSSGGVAATLSGGLDSGLVASVAVRSAPLSASGLDAYTAAPEPGLPAPARRGWDADDTGYAAATAAASPGLRQHVVRPEGRSPLDVLPRLVAGAGTPVRGGANLMWLDAISRAARAAGARVLLTGQHGNFALSAPGTGALLELLAAGRAGAARSLLLEAARRRGWLRAANDLAVRPLRGRIAHAAGRRPNLRASPYLRGAPGHPGGTDAALEARPASRAQWLGFALLTPHAWRSDPIDQWDIEWRDPTADRRLIELLLRLPLAAFRCGGRDRGLAREIGSGLLPDEVRLRTRRGAQAPEQVALIARAAPAYREALAAIRENADADEMLDLDAMEHRLSEFAAGSGAASDASAWLGALTLGLFLVNVRGGQ
jgi:asparagine synthase (glutamine-hydrolysing)